MRMLQQTFAWLGCGVWLVVASHGVAQDVSFRPGDINLDGRVSLADLMYLNAYICLYGAAPECPAAADVDGNGEAQLTDAFRIYRSLFLDEAEPFEPAPACLTASAESLPLPCEAESACPQPAPPPLEDTLTIFVSPELEAVGPPERGVGLFGRQGQVFDVPFFVFITGHMSSGLGPQGWSFGVLADSERISAAITDADHEGTDVDSYFSAGLSSTLLVPEGGATTAIVLSVIEHHSLPGSPEMASLVLRGNLRVTAPPRGEEGIVMLRIVDGLVGPGGPVSLEVVDAQEVVTPATVPLKIFVASPEAFDHFIRGDSNRDRRHDISDPIATLGMLFLGNTASSCADAADANDDGRVDISDAVFSLGCLFAGAACPSAPFPDCGLDPPSEDPLECEGTQFNCL